jgi:hypothetical protein
MSVNGLSALAVVVFLSVLVAGAPAQENVTEEWNSETYNAGCETYPDHWLCPQSRVATNAALQYSSDVECSELAGEDQGCIGTANLVTDLRFQECWVYIPLLPGNEVDYDNFQYNYDCQERVWSAGSAVNIMAFKDLVSDCTMVEGDEYYEISSCKTSGKRIAANVTLSEEEGEKYVVVLNSTEHKAFLEWWQIVAIAVVALVLVWFLRKKKK